MHAHHPFRWFFQRFEVYDMNNKLLGSLQQRFALLSKKFDLEDSNGQVVMEVSSPIWKIWTFPFEKNGRQLAKITKKWTGLFAEALTDKDTFEVEFSDPSVPQEQRQVVLASSVFVDLQYFEKKASNR